MNNYTLIPDELKLLPFWCVHSTIDGKPKTPTDISTASKLKWGDQRNLISFNAASSASHHFDGISFVLIEGCNLVCLDLDHCISNDGNVALFAQFILNYFDTYAERSIGGNGMHLWLHANKPRTHSRCSMVRYGFKELECYSSGRVMTMSGLHIPTTPLLVMNRQEQLNQLYDMLFPIRETPQPKVNPNTEHQEDDVVTKLLLSQEKYQRIWNGNFADHSVARHATIGKLLWLTNGDCEQTERIFRQCEALMKPRGRDKIDLNKPCGGYRSNLEREIHRLRDKRCAE